MIEHGAATEDDMVLAFLKGEIDSKRFGGCIEDFMAKHQLNRDQLLGRANVANVNDSQSRLSILKHCRDGLFETFPNDVQWRRAELEPSDLARLKYLNNVDRWKVASGGTRRVVDAALNVVSTRGHVADRQHIMEVTELVRAGHHFEELIVIQAEGQDLVLLEGHVRATAYAIVPPSHPMRVLVGSSAQMSSWRFL
jgi:hypothetical protein